MLLHYSNNNLLCT